MEIVNYSEARSSLKQLMEQAVEYHSPIAITRKNADPVVMISLEEYNSWQTSLYLFSTKKNRTRLLQAMEDIEKGLFKKKKLIEE